MTIGGDAHASYYLTTTTLNLTGTTNTINANLNLATNSATVYALNDASVELGCTLCLTYGSSFVVSDQVTEEASTFQNVITSVEDLSSDAFSADPSKTNVSIAYLSETKVDDGYKYTITTDVTNHQLVYDGNTKTLMVTPEPATATLSLLALAGLAARRRRA